MFPIARTATISSSEPVANALGTHLVERCTARLSYAAEMPAPHSTPAWSVAGLRLPKALENDERGAALHAALRESTRKLWPGGALLVTLDSGMNPMVAARNANAVPLARRNWSRPV